ncbi:hypothetical protein NKG94_10215 [Micromonospora sp. M12]
MRSAGVPAAAVGYVNAHGTGTKLGDIAEATALADVFGVGGVPVSSTKALTGHLLGASGRWRRRPPRWRSAGAAAADVPPRRPGPGLPGGPHPWHTRKADPEYAVTNSFGFGGQNVSLLLARVAEPRR